MKARAFSRARRGFTLVELLVTMAISLILMYGVYEIFISQQRSYTVQDQTATMQKDARMAEEFITKAVMQAGATAPADTGVSYMRGKGILAAGDHFLMLQADDPYSTDIGDITGDEITAFVVSNAINGPTNIEDAPLSNQVSVRYTTDSGSLGVISNVDFQIGIDVDEPPYTLYMIQPDPTDSNILIWEPVAENVDNLIFRYYDANGNPIPSDALTDSQYILDNIERSQIRAVEMELVLRAEREDASYDEDFTPQLGSVGTYGGGVADVNPVFTGDDAKFRRRTFRTRIAPRNLDAVNCGIIDVVSTGALCPNSAMVTATLTDGYGETLPAGETVTFTLINPPLIDLSNPAPGAVLPSGGIVATALTDGSGVATTTITYTGKEADMTIIAEAIIDCTDNQPLVVLGDTNVAFDPGDVSWIDITNDGYTNLATDLGLCAATEDFLFTARSYDFCDNDLPPGVPNANFTVYDTLNPANAGVAGAPLGFIDGGTSADMIASGQQFIIEPPASGGTQTLSNLGCLQMGVGITNSAALTWATDGIFLGAGGVLGALGGGTPLDPFIAPPATIFPNEEDIFSPSSGVAGIEACPGPPEFITYSIPSNIDGAVLTDCDPALMSVTDTFLAQCTSDLTGGGTYTIWDLNPASIPVELTTDGTRFDPALNPDIVGFLTSGQSADDGDNSITISGTTTNSLGYFDLTYTGPETCALDPSEYDAGNRLIPTITFDNTTTLNPELEPCRGCTFTMTPAIVTPCDGQALVTFSNCSLAAATPIVMEIDLATASYGTGTPPYWVDADGNPIGRVGALHILDIVTGPVDVTQAAAMLAIGDTFTNTDLFIKVYSQTNVGGAPQWSCPNTGTLAVNNVCSNFRVYYENADGTQEDITNNASKCSTEVTELFVEMQHCKYDVGLDLPQEITLTMYDELAAVFDQETLMLLPTTDTVDPQNPTPPPWEIFRGSIEVRGLPFTTNKGVASGILEYPRDSVMTLEIGQWISAMDPADICPPTPIEVTLNPPVPLCFPNAITSGGGAAWNGNFLIHWGDVVVRGIMTEPSDPKLIEKKTDAQFDGNPFGGAGNSDRFIDVYVGHAIPINPPLEDGNIEGHLFALADGMQQPFKAKGFGNYFSNISNERISDMIVELNYDLMRDLVRAENYWVTTSSGELYNPKTRVGPINIMDLLNFPPNAYYSGDFLFIDTWGIPGVLAADPLYSKPNKTDAQINQDAVDGILPVHKVSGDFYTEGIVYVAGNVEFGGLGGTTTITGTTPPEYDLDYDHNTATYVEDDIPLRADPTQANVTFDIGVHINGAFYVDGEFSGSGNPAVFGSLTGERGYDSAGGPEIWYNYKLNESGASDSLCVECCNLSATPSVLDMLPGDSITITLGGATGSPTEIIWSSSDTSIVTVNTSGVATAGPAGTKGVAVIWVVDTNNCTLAIPVRVDTECVGLTIDPAIVPDAAGTFDIDVGVSPTEFLTITNLADPADTYIFASWDWESDSPNVVDVEATHSGSYTALITGKTCGTAVITATDTTGACTSIYQSIVTVGSSLDFGTFTPFYGDPNTPSHFFVEDITTVTTVGASGPLSWSASPAASVIITPLDADWHTVTIEFLEPNSTGFTIQITDQFGCYATRTFFIQCTSPSIDNNPPIDGTIYGTKSINGTSVEWRANVSDQVPLDPLDQIDRVVFNINPDPGGLGVVYPFTDFTSEYCGFGVSDNCAAIPADVSTWPNGVYTMASTVYANCGTTQVSSTAASLITIDNCDYTDNFSATNTFWNLDCVGNGCNAAGTSANIGGGSAELVVYNDPTSAPGPAIMWLDNTLRNYTTADDFVSYVTVNGINNPGALPDVTAALVVNNDITSAVPNMVRVFAHQVTPGDDTLHHIYAEAQLGASYGIVQLAANVAPPYTIGIEKSGEWYRLIFNPPAGPSATAFMGGGFTDPIYLGLTAGPTFSAGPGPESTSGASFSNFILDCLFP